LFLAATTTKAENFLRNCAALARNLGPLFEQTAETHALTFDTNVLGVVLSLKHEMLVMMKQSVISPAGSSMTAAHIRTLVSAVIFTPRPPSLHVRSSSSCSRVNFRAPFFFRHPTNTSKGALGWPGRISTRRGPTSSTVILLPGPTQCALAVDALLQAIRLGIDAPS
jgi:hypothetical protein